MAHPGMDWMQMNMNRFAKRPISELVFPSSHDAGTYKLSYGTVFGTEANVLTQNRSVFEQLCFGVRELDIRPYLVPEFNSDWYCGHYSKTEVGWQGGSCASIAEVVSDINRFTTGGHNELIIVRVGNTTKINFDSAVDSEVGGRIERSDWTKLFDELKNLKYLYGKDQAGTEYEYLNELNLERFISGTPAVLVIVDNERGENDKRPSFDEVMKYGFWPNKMRGSNNERLQLYEISGLVTRSQTDIEAINSTVNPLFKLGVENFSSVLNLAKAVQNKNFPTLLQRATQDWYINHSKPNRIWMDRIENADLLTFCLALSHQRNNKIAWRHDAVLVYGGQVVTFGHVHDNFNKYKNSFQPYPVHNDNFGGDPWSGMVKSCAAIYQDLRYPWQQKDFFKGRWAREGSSLNIEADIVKFSYGGDDQVLNPKIYYSLFGGIMGGDAYLEVTDEAIGKNPKPGEVKKAYCQYVVKGGETKYKEVSEGGNMYLG